MYTHAQTSKHEPTCGHACLRVTYGMWRYLVLWWGHYICEMAYIRLSGGAGAFPTQGGILTEGSQPSFTPLVFFYFLFFFAFLCISLMASPPLWSILKYLDNDWNKLILCADIHDPQGRNPTGSGYYPLAFSFEECFLSLNHPWNCLWKQCGKGQALSEKILGRWLDDPSVNQCWSQASCNQSDQQQESAYCGASC